MGVPLKTRQQLADYIRERRKLVIAALDTDPSLTPQERYRWLCRFRQAWQNMIRARWISLRHEKVRRRQDEYIRARQVSDTSSTGPMQ